MKYQKTEITFDDLKDFDLFKQEAYILSVNKEGVEFEFLINLKSNENLLILGSGAYNSDKISLPVFQRHAWKDDFNCSTIYYNDPTLYLSKINLAWGYGESKRFYLEEIAEILRIITSKIKIPNNKTFFYGSSGGGYMSIILAGYLKAKAAIVNNPQTDIRKATYSAFKNFKQYILKDEIIVKRANLVEFFKSINYVPRIIYYQNLACEFDMDKHVLPFIDELKNLEEEYFINNVSFEFYLDNELGHNPMPKEETIEILNKIISDDAVL